MPFQKGQTGNPNGRPRQTQEQRDQKEQFQMLLRKATIPALESIIEIACDRRSRDRFNACKYIIDKSFGADATFLSDDSEPLTIRIVRSDITNIDQLDDSDDWE